MWGFPPKEGMSGEKFISVMTRTRNCSFGPLSYTSSFTMGPWTFLVSLSRDQANHSMSMKFHHKNHAHPWHIRGLLCQVATAIPFSERLNAVTWGVVSPLVINHTLTMQRKQQGHMKRWRTFKTWWFRGSWGRDPAEIHRHKLPPISHSEAENYCGRAVRSICWDDPEDTC